MTVKTQKRELAERIARKRGLKTNTAAYKDTVKSLSRLSLMALQNLK